MPDDFPDIPNPHDYDFYPELPDPADIEFELTEEQLRRLEYDRLPDYDVGRSFGTHGFDPKLEGHPPSGGYASPSGFVVNDDPEWVSLPGVNVIRPSGPSRVPEPHLDDLTYVPPGGRLEGIRLDPEHYGNLREDVSQPPVDDLNNARPIDLGPPTQGDLVVPEPAIRPPGGYTPPIAQPTRGFQMPAAPPIQPGFTAPLSPLPTPGFTMPEDPELRPPFYRYP